jgi:hypothetical protein
MMKKIASVMVACLLTFTMLCQQTAAASSSPDKETRFAQKVKASILKLGVGQTTRVDVKLKDKTRLTGYVSEISDNSFAVTDLKSGEARTVAYPDVVQVKGNNLSTGVKITIAVAIIVGVAIFLYLIKGAFCDGC